MKQFWMRVLPCVCLVLLLTFGFLSSCFVAFAADVETTPWYVTVKNAGENNFTYVSSYLVTGSAVNYQAWSVRVATGGGGLTFTYSVPGVGGGYEIVNSTWHYSSDLTIVEFTVTSGSVTKTYTAGQIASGDAFAVAPYRYGALPTQIKIASQAEKQLTFWQTVTNALNVVKDVLQGSAGKGFWGYLSDLFEDIRAAVNSLKAYLSVTPDPDFGGGEDFSDIDRFELTILDDIQDAMEDLRDSFSISFLFPTFAFVGNIVNSIWDDFGSFRVMFLFPIFLGIVMMILRHGEMGTPRDINYSSSRGDIYISHNLGSSPSQPQLPSRGLVPVRRR